MSEVSQRAGFIVTFKSQLSEDAVGYESMAKRMLELAHAQEGFLGMDSVRDSQGAGISVSYWRDLESIKRWRDHVEHQRAKALGKSKWYRHFTVYIAKVVDA